MEFDVEGTTIEWRGPSPFVFLPIPKGLSEEIRALARRVSYGWGVIPVTARIGGTTFTTSMIPRDGVYLLPLKVVVQRSEAIEVGHTIHAHVSVSLGSVA